MSREEFLAALLKLKAEEPDVFMQLILDTIKRNPDLAIADDAPTSKKILALEKMLRHLEEKEEYEDCAFIKKISDQIKDGSKE